MGIPKDGLQNLANTLEGDKDLNSPRELSAEAEKELAIVEKTIREAHVDRVNPELKCILVILPSRHSPTGILMQREDVILEWIFLPCKPNKKLKTYTEKISDLIHKGPEFETLEEQNEGECVEYKIRDMQCCRTSRWERFYKTGEDFSYTKSQSAFVYEFGTSKE
ncbi:hypothetical protein STEG23_016757 [Scotinomys teguina]